MILEKFSSGPADTNTYLLGCSQTLRAVVIDVPLESSKFLIKRAKELHLQIEKILLTHSHWDHIAEVHALKKKLECPVHIHSADAANLIHPGADRIPLFFPIKGEHPDGYLTDGQIVNVGELELEVIHTPGHSPGGVCFYIPSKKILISGDTLFRGTIGNLSFSTGDPAAMWKSLRRLAQLPKETKVYPGHGDATTIGAEGWIAHAEERFS